MRRSKLTPKKREGFLDSLRAGNTISFACDAFNLARRAMYQLREDDEAFRAEWDEAYEEGAEILEQEARRRAVDGIDKPIVYRGVITGKVKEYSDTLLIFLIKGRKPDVYGDKIQQQQSGELLVKVEYEDRSSQTS